MGPTPLREGVRNLYLQGERIHTHKEDLLHLREKKVMTSTLTSMQRRGEDIHQMAKLAIRLLNISEDESTTHRNLGDMTQWEDKDHPLLQIVEDKSHSGTQEVGKPGLERILDVVDPVTKAETERTFLCGTQDGMIGRNKETAVIRTTCLVDPGTYHPVEKTHMTANTCDQTIGILMIPELWDIIHQRTFHIHPFPLLHKTLHFIDLIQIIIRIPEDRLVI